MKNVFNTINDNILINKFDLYEVRGTASKSIVNYLNGRQLYVQIDIVNSGYNEPTHGIHQRSIQCPRLLLFYFIICAVYLHFRSTS